MKTIISTISVVFILLFTGCDSGTKPDIKVTKVTIDPLPSWNDTNNKRMILDFVAKVTDSSSKDFVPEKDRIATFDNDGTLWCEQPLYFEFIYSFNVMKDIIPNHPELLKKPEIKALADGDKETFLKSGEKGLLEVFALSHTMQDIDKFQETATNWLDTAVHGKFKQKYIDLTYKPMVELLEYLRANNFTTYIVSGGSSMFIRNFSEKAYGIPTGQVIGSMLKAEFIEKDSTFNIKLSPDVFHIDDNVGKPVGIYQFIGKKPILAFGNSDGDLQMLQWTTTNTYPNLELILHHTDAEREYAYDRESSVGKLDKALDEAHSRGWVVVDMKSDFKKVFSYE